MSWDDFDKKLADSGGSDFLKIKDGDEVLLVFRGEPYAFYRKFQDKAHYQTRVEGSSFKFQINVVVKDGDSFVRKVLEQGATFGELFKACREEYGLDCLYKVKRKGATKDDTTYAILFKENLSEEQKTAVNLLTLFPLGPRGRSVKSDDLDQRNSLDHENHPMDEDIPF